MRIEFKILALTGLLLVLSWMSQAQTTYKIQADSVEITNCDSAELILENHTQGVKGFLFNTGRGRTIFKKGLIKVNGGLYLVGADTLNLAANAWMQGGNAFGATGVLGTLDTNALAFYTNQAERARFTKAGNFLLGTTVDNGNKLQVNGASSFNGAGTFTGNLNIGTATVTNTGNLIGTNALLFNYVISKYHNYRSNSDPYVGRLENILYNYTTRFQTVQTTDTSTHVMTIDMKFIASEMVTGNIGLVYPQGQMCFSFWNNGVPQSVSVMMKDSANSTWYGPFSSSTNIGYGGAGFFQVAIPGSFNYVNEIMVTITPQAGGVVNLQDMEYLPSNGGGGLLNPYPYVGKEGNEYLYGYFYFRNAGIDNVRISPFSFGSSYFLNNLTLGSTTDNSSGAKLQVTGNVTATGTLGLGTTSPSTQLHTTGGVRFAGLTNNNTQTRVVVSDTTGKLYYRDASTLASTDIMGSSLAINGPARIGSLTLSAKAGSWPDFVFDSGYRLMELAELGDYIRRNHHLPGIASARQTADSGVNVVESQAALLRKIEELTLYAVGQDEKLRMQASEMDRLKQELKELKDLIIQNTRR